MHQTHNLQQRMRLFISIFLPILIYQLANFSASFVDTTMTGQYDTLHLAGVSMATSLWIPFFDLLIGIVSALVPIIGHHLGQGNKKRIASDFYQFIYLSFIGVIANFICLGICGRSSGFVSPWPRAFSRRCS